MRWSQDQLIQTFVGQGLVYYLIISALNLTNVVIYFRINEAMASATPVVALNLLIPDILACRMILSLRASNKEHEEISQASAQVHGIWAVHETSIHTTRLNGVKVWRS